MKATKRRAKLSVDQAASVRRSSEPGPVIARRLGVHKSTISRIRTWKAWAS